MTDLPEIIGHPQNVTTKEGDNVTLSCNATGNPNPTILWTKDGSPMSSNSRISLSADNKQLTVTYVSRTDSGEYRCIAENSIGNVTSIVSTVNVQCKSASLSFTAGTVTMVHNSCVIGILNLKELRHDILSQF